MAKGKARKPAAPPAETPAPAAAEEAAADDDDGKEPDFAAEPEFPFDHTTTQVILDVRALCSIPFDIQADPTFAFRVLLLPSGKTVHVPNEPGCYAVGAPWRSQKALSLVYFKQSTQRPPELVLRFGDYSILRETVGTIYVESLQLPLTKQRNVFNETPRLTSMKMVAGFRSIDCNLMPWQAQLPAALARQAVFTHHKISGSAELLAFVRSPLADRIAAIIKFAEDRLEKHTAGVRRQDPAMAERIAGTFETHLEAVEQALKNLPPEKYDRQLEQRVFEVHVMLEETPRPDWLSSPVKTKISAGTAEMYRTILRERRPREEGEELLADEEEEEEEEAEEEVEEVPDLQKRGVAVSGGEKRARKATHHFDPPVPEPKKPKEGKGKAPAAAPAPAPAPAPESKPPLHRKDGTPYTRGPYGPRDNSAAKAILAAANRAAAAEKNSGEVKELKDKVKVLEEKNRLLQEQLAAERLSNAIVVKNAELEMANALQPQLLRQYQIGLQDGANLTMGSKLNMPMASPVSLGGLSQGSSNVSGISGSTPI